MVPSGVVDGSGEPRVATELVGREVVPRRLVQEAAAEKATIVVVEGTAPSKATTDEYPVRKELGTTAVIEVLVALGGMTLTVALDSRT